MDSYQEFDDIEHVTFCYFILGTAFPLVWAIFFISFSWPNTEEFQTFRKQCNYLYDWGMIVSGFLLTIALFYVFLTIFSIYANKDTSVFSRETAFLNPKYKRAVLFEENYWRIFIVFSLLTLFASFAIIDQWFGTEDLIKCGNLFKLGELFFYIICGFFSLIAIFSIIVFATERKPRDSDAQRPNQQQYPRYAHPYQTIDDMF